MLFVGIDLAWSTKNGSGIAVIEGDEKSAKMISCGVVYSDDEIINYVNNAVGKNKALIAIDATLIVPNQEGRRIAEVQVGALFRKYDAGAHPANRIRLSSWTGTIRGEEISKILEKNKFKQDPYIKKLEQSRKFFEVYPHPSMVVLFDLKRILQYKAKPHRDYDFRWNVFRDYQKLLIGLSKAKPALSLPKEVTSKSLEELKGGKLKDYEDTLDGIFCSYIAYYAWVNPEKCAVLGSMEGGYIMTPVFDSMRAQINSEQKTL